MFLGKGLNTEAALPRRCCPQCGSEQRPVVERVEAEVPPKGLLPPHTSCRGVAIRRKRVEEKAVAASGVRAGAAA